jgi:hypothetical protein
VEGSSVRKSFSKLLAAATVRLVGLWTTNDLTYLLEKCSFNA